MHSLGMDEVLAPEVVETRIYLMRGQRVMLDSDLAALYGVPTKRLNEQVRRNRSRFPEDFMFRLTPAEAINLRSQIATSSGAQVHGGRRHLPYVFTEQGVAMLSSVLASDRAIQVNIEIMRFFVRERRERDRHLELAERLRLIEQNCDVRFRIVFETLERLITPPDPEPRRRIGYPRAATVEA